MTMKKHSISLWHALAMAVAVSLTFSACSDDDDDAPAAGDAQEDATKTLFMYFPWSNNLTSAFLQNISDMETAIAANGLGNTRVMVFICSTYSAAQLFEIKTEDGVCYRDTLKTYESPSYTTSDGIASILSDVVTAAPAQNYAMTIGCHGMGWLHVQNKSTLAADTFTPHWDVPGALPTRYFGGTSSRYQTDVTTLAEAIEMAGLHFDFILFDDCYMSSIEAAYDLRHVTDHIIACPTEIMSYGMPYARIGQQLIGQTDYAAVCEEFYDFYSSYVYPYGTIAVTDCSQLDSLARVMKRINTDFTFDESLRDGLQRMDGYTPAIFYDMGDYVSALCTDADMLSEFDAQLDRTIPYKAHTEKFYTAAKGAIDIRTYSGTTTSAPSTNSRASDWSETEWAQDTEGY